jgi:tRNA(Ile)-lysidine synthase
MSQTTVTTLLEETLTQSLREHDCVLSLNIPTPRAIAIAYSGGLDSSVLLAYAIPVAKRLGLSLFAFHIHHGISKNADDWLMHCETTANTAGVGFEAVRVNLADSAKTGVEEAARLARYRALGALCAKHDVALLLTAHHQNDQAETMLLHLLRGTGVGGLSGMDDWNVAPDLLGNATVRIVRPLLAVSRAQLETAASVLNLSTIHDESNDDVRYTRNALRHSVMPVLGTHFPGFEERLTRTARHTQAAQRLLDVMAKDDLARCTVDGNLSVVPLRLLDTDRQDNLLRHWLRTQGLRLPTTAWLLELRTQLLEAKDDAQICVTHPDCHIRRYRDRVLVSRRHGLPDPYLAPARFVWQGEASIDFPAYHGSVVFEASTRGFEPDWLREQALTLGYRSGGERLKLAHNRPTKPIKYLYQAEDIPSWERPFLPLVRTSDAILFAAGLGMDCHAVKNAPENTLIAIRWVAQ